MPTYKAFQTHTQTPILVSSKADILPKHEGEKNNTMLDVLN